jgi:DNA-binding NarL/FixJ family response regulator
LITMLIVEDQGPMRAALREFLQSAYPRATVLEADDGASAIAACRRYGPRLVFMDLGLPDTSGIELTTRVKSLLPDSDVIVVSQHAGQAYVERARAAGAVAYVTKDKIYSELLPLAERALGGAAQGSSG